MGARFCSTTSIVLARSLACWAVSGALIVATPQSCMNNAGPCLTAIVSAASFERGAIAPGELVSLFGTGLGPAQGVQSQATQQNPFPTQLASVEVIFDETPAPLVWVQATQINAAVPWSLAPGNTTQVCVIYNNVRGNCLVSPVTQTCTSRIPGGQYL